VSSIHLVSPALLTSCRVAVVFAIQSWLAESPEQAKSSATPAYFQVGMSGEFQASAAGMPLTAVQPCHCSCLTLRCSSHLRQVCPAWALEPKHRPQHLLRRYVEPTSWWCNQRQGSRDRGRRTCLYSIIV
jgi:hypothetical protein